MSTLAQSSHKLVGHFEWADDKQQHIQLDYDRLAVSGRTLLLASLVGAVADVKCLRAALGSDVRQGIDLSGEVPEGREPEGFTATADPMGYQLYVHRMPYGTAHAVMISRRPGFILSGDSEALWAELKDPRYTTPLLKRWLPYLESELESQGKLTACECVGCYCRVLTATTKNLDELVESGLKQGLITIEDDNA